MSDQLDSKLKRLESLLSDLGKDVDNRLMVIDHLMRDVAVKVEVLERRADIQRRLDAVKLREKAHNITDRILELLDADNPDAASAAILYVAKTILEIPISLDDPRSVQMLASAAKALEGGTLPPLPGGGKFQV